jgi:serine protease AprX
MVVVRRVMLFPLIVMLLPIFTVACGDKGQEIRGMAAERLEGVAEKLSDEATIAPTLTSSGTRVHPTDTPAPVQLTTTVIETPAPTIEAKVVPVPVVSAPLEGREDPFNVIFAARLTEARPTEFSKSEIPRDAFSDRPFDRKKDEQEVNPRPTEKIHPLLKEWLEERSPAESELIVVNFADELKIPRFPEPDTDEARDSRANKEALDRAQRLVRRIQENRAPTYDRLTKDLAENYRAQVLETFWLVNAMLVKIPLGAVSSLAERRDVLYVEPEQTEDEPPQNASTTDDVDDGRARIVSDPYFNLGQTGGWIGLLDTGLRFTHTLFDAPSNIAFRFDCTDGTCDSSPDITDDCWNHGTSSAAIISGNGNLGNAYRGVTGITLDSFKVYPAGCGGLNTTATVKAFEKAVAVLDRVIVAEMQSGSDYVGAISVAADNAFDAGAVVIAANGNNGPAGDTVNAPASAHRVIGVGNFDVQTLNQINSQSRGSTPDNRFKPDIQVPTNSETASSASDTALRRFGGTSGATPYAAGAAALLRNWLRDNSGVIDPGQVYAQLILSGQQPYPFNNTTGAGPLKLPTNGRAWWGKVSVTDGTTIDIPLNIASGKATTLDGALWWPETAQSGSTAAEQHNDIDLHLLDPSGVQQDHSWSIPSVFERARVDGPVVSGTWTLRIRGFNVPSGSQTVYWAAHVRD